MSRQLNDLTGMTYGTLTVVGRSKNVGKATMWTVKCECGFVKIVRATNLSSGRTNSCSHCINAGKNLPNYTPYKKKTISHGATDTPTWNSWKRMRQRCLGYDKDQSKYYLSKGVTFCYRWTSYINFENDMGLRPTYTNEKGRVLLMTLDRIDPDGDYTPDNCRWATHKQQRANWSKPYSSSSTTSA